jgi:hypothetical protein
MEPVQLKLITNINSELKLLKLSIIKTVFWSKIYKPFCNIPCVYQPPTLGESACATILRDKIISYQSSELDIYYFLFFGKNYCFDIFDVACGYRRSQNILNSLANTFAYPKCTVSIVKNFKYITDQAISSERKFTVPRNWLTTKRLRTKRRGTLHCYERVKRKLEYISDSD